MLLKSTASKLCYTQYIGGDENEKNLDRDAQCHALRLQFSFRGQWLR